MWRWHAIFKNWTNLTYIYILMSTFGLHKRTSLIITRDSMPLQYVPYQIIFSKIIARIKLQSTWCWFSMNLTSVARHLGMLMYHVFSCVCNMIICIRNYCTHTSCFYYTWVSKFIDVQICKFLPTLFIICPCESLCSVNLLRNLLLQDNFLLLKYF